MHHRLQQSIIITRCSCVTWFTLLLCVQNVHTSDTPSRAIFYCFRPRRSNLVIVLPCMHAFKYGELDLDLADVRVKIHFCIRKTRTTPKFSRLTAIGLRWWGFVAKLFHNYITLSMRKLKRNTLGTALFRTDLHWKYLSIYVVEFIGGFSEDCSCSPYGETIAHQNTKTRQPQIPTTILWI